MTKNLKAFRCRSSASSLYHQLSVERDLRSPSESFEGNERGAALLVLAD